MIDQRVQKAYSFYKNLYPIPIVMFRIGDNFCAYHNDAKRIIEALHLDQIQSDNEIQVESGRISDFTRKCYEQGLTIRTISYRNNLGEYLVPDAEIIASDQKIDY